jgi:hypothetical protein
MALLVVDRAGQRAQRLVGVRHVGVVRVEAGTELIIYPLAPRAEFGSLTTHFRDELWHISAKKVARSTRELSVLESGQPRLDRLQLVVGHDATVAQGGMA